MPANVELRDEVGEEERPKREAGSEDKYKTSYTAPAAPTSKLRGTQFAIQKRRRSGDIVVAQSHDDMHNGGWVKGS